MTHTPDQIRAQLERILRSKDFVASERLTDFLRFVIEETLAGRSHEISQQTVGVKGMGYPANFDPQSNPVVRIQAGLLRRALDRYYYTEGANDPLRIEIPKGRYVPTFSANEKRPLESNASSSNDTTTSVQVDPLISVPDDPSVAVLSFAFLGAAERDNYLASGLTEEIIIALTHFPNFLVIGPLSRSVVSENGSSIRAINQQYQVRFVLDGTIRKSSEGLRVTAKLADSQSGELLWGQAQDYSLETTSIREIEEEVVGHVAATVADAYGVIPRTLAKDLFTQHADTVSDYEAVLRFYHNIRVLTNESHVNALEALERTLQRDPDHALAMAMLGDLTAATYQFGFEDSTAGLERAEKLGRKALSLDPNSQAARFTMALVHFLNFQRSRFLEEAELGLLLNPNHALYVAAFSLHLSMVGEWERGVKLMKKAMRLNPHHPGWYHLVPYMNHYRQADYELAWKDAERFNIPAFHWDPLIRAAVLGKLGRQAEASEAVNELLALVPDFRSRGQSLIRRYAYLDEHVDMLAVGLRKAGLELEAEVSG